ncbi:patatin-like phospholipase family protein [Limosilactobacillus caccae]|uniref:patatin-like phospholipase family protein n=1 Tax=Limosilactobacillus caccae TaxID=1926284 RepID=UPI0009711A47|nr:patatin family protein [Limosilactobacillus caccae]
MLYNAALVLEGGAFRGQYTAGVVDTFLAHHIEFKSVIGVSAGSLCGVNFVSKQYGRAANININHRHDHNYISLTRAFKKQIINLDYLFEDHGYSWQNFDETAYRRSASHFTAVATSVQSGKTVLFTDPTGKDLTDALKASSSMPFLSDPQMTSQGPCLDGGITDSIPFDIAQQQGYDKIVIVRTRDVNYRKKLSSPAVKRLYHLVYKDHPAFAEAGINRPLVYNQQIAQISHLVHEGKVFNIAPTEPVKIKRIEGNVKKIRALYETGRQEGEAIIPDLIKYLEK